MIQIHFNMTKKEYRRTHVQAMTLYYMRIYLCTLIIGTAVVSLIARLTGSATLQRSSFTMVLTFIPVIILCTFLAIGMAMFDVRRASKKHPELIEGEFKIKFEKTFMMIQINGQNKKLQYNAYRFYRGFANSFILYQTHGGTIVVLKNLVTKEQRKQIKSFVKGV